MIPNKAFCRYSYPRYSILKDIHLKWSEASRTQFEVYQQNTIDRRI